VLTCSTEQQAAWLGFVDMGSCSWITICGRTSTYILAGITPGLALCDVGGVNGTNGYRLGERYYAPKAHVPPQWREPPLMISRSDMLEGGSQPYHLLSSTNKAMPATVSLTSSVWQLSTRIYVTNQIDQVFSRTMAGNMMGQYTLAGDLYPGGVEALTIPSLTNATTYLDRDDPRIVRFSGTGDPGVYLDRGGDCNGDGYDDLLIGSFNSTESWVASIRGHVNTGSCIAILQRTIQMIY